MKTEKINDLFGFILNSFNEYPFSMLLKLFNNSVLTEMLTK